MNRRLIPPLMLVCAIVVGLFIGLNFTSPELYIPQNHSTSLYHVNPQYSDVTSWQSSEDLLDIMSALMDDTGSVVVKIREKDFETAEQEYRRLVGLGHNFDNIVVDLELSETEMGEFSKYNQRNQELIRRLLDDSKRFEELKKLEVRYRDEKNPSALYSVTYEGEGLKTQIQEVTRQYDQQAPAFTQLGQQFSLNTTGYLQSVSEVESLAQEASSTQETRKAEADTLKKASPVTAMPASVDSVTLEVQPDQATFGDTLRLNAVLSGRFPGEQTVDVYLDSQRWASGRSDAEGRFVYDLRVEQIRAERHVLYAAHEGVYSPLVNVTIVPTGAALTLEVRQEAERNISVSGILTTAGGLAVPGAEVDIYLNNIRVMNTRTGGDGVYRVFLPLQPGTYTFRSASTDSTFPLEAAESTPVTLSVAGSTGGARSVITTIMIYATFLILFSMGAVIYYRHQRGREGPFELKNPFAFLKLPGRKETPAGTPPEPAAAAPPPPGEASLPPPAVEEAAKTPDRSRDEVLAQYRQLVIGRDFQNAVQGLYLFLRDQLARKYRIRDHKSFTPRELWRLTNNKPCFGPFTKFIHQYETIRYGGMDPSPEESESLVRWFGETSSALESGSD
ncbi:MAG: carboxypeptidase-like regulatory domain-containing protein [Methanomicrobiales archaeon]|nr:carboxypeptidase-like regulatory domain-containing protein [Methanomicrobiales archaeon]